MEKYIPLDPLLAEIEKQRQLIFPKNTGEMKVADIPKPLEQGWLNALSWMKKTINTLEVKEVDLDKEIQDLIYNRFFDLEGIAIAGSSLYATVEDMVHIARHFFELGLQAQKGE